MAQISYETFQTNKEERESRMNTSRVGFFALKNDQDEAIVRFMHNSPEDFDIMYNHSVIVSGKRRKVNCIRDPKGDINECPLCAAGNKLQTNVYLHLIEYTKDDSGNIIATPKIWERTSSYITTLKNLCDEYPPLSNHIFKIKRNGAPGSIDTTYSIMYASPTIYSPDLYVKDDSCFDDIKALGTCVLDKNYEELQKLANPEAEEPQSYTNSQNTNQIQNEARVYNPGSVHIVGESDTFIDRPRRLN